MYPQLEIPKDLGISVMPAIPGRISTYSIYPIGSPQDGEVKQSCSITDDYKYVR